MEGRGLTACRECDLLHRKAPLPRGGSARCARCGARLYRHRENTVDRTLALCLAGLILFLLTNAFPLLGIEMQGQTQETVLLTGVWVLFSQGWEIMALAVLFTCAILPLAYLAGMLYLLVPLRMGLRPWRGAAAFRYIRALQPWGMLEVFVLGVLISYVKLSHMAALVLGPSLFSLGALMLVMAESMVSLDARALWDRLGEAP